ncbi:hypothetical protein Taro_033030 [Colocasia esculenta]|uniref:Uncharacterized protein n=1 Tax=Colocasia esculenta TaxID=4460 RepID=A0A843WB96_COLES|nr:hypothetical protein [Colocasia esculenta]
MCSCGLERGGGGHSDVKAPTGWLYTWRCDFLAAVGRMSGGGDGAVVVVPVASSVSPFQL